MTRPLSIPEIEAIKARGWANKSDGALPALCDLALANQWRTIDSAPKDGTPVDLWASGQRWTDCTWTGAYWFTPYGVYDSGAEMELHGHIPTHWMPITPPPGATP